MSHDESVVLRMSGFYYLGTRYVSKPKISVSTERHGYRFHIGQRSYHYHWHPGDLAGWVVAWSHLYFGKLLPRVQKELAREVSPERLHSTRSVAIQCPHCQQMFGGVLTL
jgi:hypothetical protein